MGKNKVIETTIGALIPDDKNFNKGTEYGKHLMDKSFSQFGAGRSVLIDKNNRIIAGNKSTEQFGENGGEKVIVIETTGDTLVAVKRTDIDLDSKEGREMALADNATAKANLDFDMDVVCDVCADLGIDAQDWGVDVSYESANPDDFGDEFTLPNEGKAKFGTMTFVVTDQQREFINDCIAVAINCDGMLDDAENKNENGAALNLICTEWFERFKGIDKDFETIEKEFKELRLYMVNALRESGRKSTDVDKLLGTSGMSGHYFGESQWMFPTREAYEKLKTIMKLDRDYMECKLKEMAYKRATKAIGMYKGEQITREERHEIKSHAQIEKQREEIAENLKSE